MNMEVKTKMEHKHECDNFKKFRLHEPCHTEVVEDITIKVPVIVHAHADIEHVRLECDGHYIEKHHWSPHENKRDTDKFTIVQKIKVCIPLKFEAECDVCESSVDFDLHDTHAA
jgi:hypothetical protein